jgi:hypothetical protein
MPMRLGSKPEVGRRLSFEVDSSLEGSPTLNDRLSYARLEEPTLRASDVSPEDASRVQLEKHVPYINSSSKSVMADYT